LRLFGAELHNQSSYPTCSDNLAVLVVSSTIAQEIVLKLMKAANLMELHPQLGLTCAAVLIIIEYQINLISNSNQLRKGTSL
jgi:hypothetical protein